MFQYCKNNILDGLGYCRNDFTKYILFYQLQEKLFVFVYFFVFYTTSFLKILDVALHCTAGLAHTC
jgi:hypothetical protein